VIRQPETASFHALHQNAADVLQDQDDSEKETTVLGREIVPILSVCCHFY